MQAAGREDIPSGPSAWCCTLDADIPLLLTVEEEEQYLERSLKAAANSCADLVPCPQPNCDGVAVAGQGGSGLRLACSEVQLCRAMSVIIVLSRHMQDFWTLYYIAFVAGHCTASAIEWVSSPIGRGR